MGMLTLTNSQARKFMLIKQGLIDEYRFIEKNGVLDFVRQAGCIQFDPIDVCGKNSELVLQSRVKGFTKEMLYELLYEDRLLVDYFDKNLAIINIEDWKYFERIRNSFKKSARGDVEISKVTDDIKAIIRDKGPVCSKDIDFGKKIDWYWSATSLSRAALEVMYFRGELIIHHKKGTIKYYALAEDYIPSEILNAKDPFEDEIEHIKWRTLRRISAVGFLWNKPSDAWLYIKNMKAKERNKVFEQLLEEGKILEFAIEGSKNKFYCLSADKWIIDKVLSDEKIKSRTELIAPLDSMLWDRKLIKEIFDFDYKWEIYAPQAQRKYGYYVLPILSGQQFIGRAEIVKDTKNNTLIVKNIWLEEGVKYTQKLIKELQKCFDRFRKFHNLQDIEYLVELGKGH